MIFGNSHPVRVKDFNLGTTQPSLESSAWDVKYNLRSWCCWNIATDECEVDYINSEVLTLVVEFLSVLSMSKYETTFECQWYPSLQANFDRNDADNIIDIPDAGSIFLSLFSRNH